ncbi:hypothetical protein [Pseudomonas alvandae]|nr:hypothetical protein [Pseudomonas canavaninivorans]UVM72709.1 hypothetical protein LOY40_00550 [Pseudomonas canavaninivorans]
MDFIHGQHQVVPGRKGRLSLDGFGDFGAAFDKDLLEGRGEVFGLNV